MDAYVFHHRRQDALLCGKIDEDGNRRPLGFRAMRIGRLQAVTYPLGSRCTVYHPRLHKCK